MKQTKITIILSIILLAFFSSLFILQYALFYADQPTFPDRIENVIHLSASKQWNEADQALKKVESIWNQAQPLIAIKYADQDYTVLNVAFVGLRSAINAKNSHEAEKEGKACLWVFKNITSISPSP
ncbi:MAG: DUF4363 family protein [Vallitaleaceae bacterium]|nr:DUF4363 family protein [Vallitaleaceae bacterium]